MDTSLGGLKKVFLEQKFSKAQTAANLKGVIKSAAAAATPFRQQHEFPVKLRPNWPERP